MSLTFDDELELLDELEDELEELDDELELLDELDDGFKGSNGGIFRG